MKLLKICIFILVSFTHSFECTKSEGNSSSTVSTVISSDSHKAAAPPLPESIAHDNANKVAIKGIKKLEDNPRSRRFLGNFFNEIKRAFHGRSRGQRRPFQGQSWQQRQSEEEQAQELLNQQILSQAQAQALQYSQPYRQPIGLYPPFYNNPAINPVLHPYLYPSILG